MPASPIESVLYTHRLQLALLASADLEDYCCWYGDPQVMAHIAPVLDRPRALRSFAAALAFNAESGFRKRYWIARTRFGTAIGLFSLERMSGDDVAEIGAIIAPATHGQGYAPEAIPVLAELAFSAMGLQRLVALHRAGQNAAGSVLRRLGFTAVPQPEDHTGPALCRWELSRADWRTPSGSTSAPQSG